MGIELFLVRHAETDHTKAGRYCSYTDVSLNERGVSQAVNLQKMINGLSVDVVFSSLYRRASETAQILFPNHEILSSPSLAELNFGLWEGMTYEEIKQQYNGLYDDWLMNPYSCSPPSGEKLLDLEKRVVDFLQKVFQDYQNKKVACISHAGPIKTAVRYLLNEDFQDFWKITINLASVSYFKLENGKVVTYNLDQK